MRAPGCQPPRPTDHSPACPGAATCARPPARPPLQLEKLLAKANDKVDDERFEEWIEAVEGWNSHVNKVNELAYTSSFGEYNPGGGKDQIAKYLELARAEVVLARDSLKKMIELLNI